MFGGGQQPRPILPKEEGQMDIGNQMDSKKGGIRKRRKINEAKKDLLMEIVHTADGGRLFDILNDDNPSACFEKGKVWEKITELYKIKTGEKDWNHQSIRALYRRMKSKTPDGAEVPYREYSKSPEKSKMYRSEHDLEQADSKDFYTLDDIKFNEYLTRSTKKGKRKRRYIPEEKKELLMEIINNTDDGRFLNILQDETKSSTPMDKERAWTEITELMKKHTGEEWAHLQVRTLYHRMKNKDSSETTPARPRAKPRRRTRRRRSTSSEEDEDDYDEDQEDPDYEYPKNGPPAQEVFGKGYKVKRPSVLLWENMRLLQQDPNFTLFYDLPVHCCDGVLTWNRLCLAFSLPECRPLLEQTSGIDEEVSMPDFTVSQLKELLEARFPNSFPNEGQAVTYTLEEQQKHDVYAEELLYDLYGVSNISKPKKDNIKEEEPEMSDFIVDDEYKGYRETDRKPRVKREYKVKSESKPKIPKRDPESDDDGDDFEDSSWMEDEEGYRGYRYSQNSHFPFPKVELGSEPEDKTYYCDQCDFETKKRQKLNYHRTYRHDPDAGKIRCEPCNKTFTSKLAHYHHMRAVHCEVKPRCDQCGLQFAAQHSLKNHIRFIHEGKGAFCDQCNYKCPSKAKLAEHIAAEHEGKLYNCDLCEYQNKDKRTLKRHIMVKHQGVMYSCDLCEYQATTEWSIRRHKHSTHKGSEGVPALPRNADTAERAQFPYNNRDAKMGMASFPRSEDEKMGMAALPRSEEGKMAMTAFPRNDDNKMAMAAFSRSEDAKMAMTAFTRTEDTKMEMSTFPRNEDASDRAQLSVYNNRDGKIGMIPRRF